VKVIIDVDPQTGALQLGSDAPMPPMQMHWYLTVAAQVVLDGLKNGPPKPSVEAVPASVLRRLDGGVNGK